MNDPATAEVWKTVFSQVFGGMAQGCDGPEGRYPCQSFTDTLRSLLSVGFEQA